MEHFPLIRRTGQLWKLIFFILFQFTFLLGSAYGIYLAITGHSQQLAIASLGLVLGVWVVGLLTIRCPKCKELWLLEALKGFQALFLESLSKLEKCPSCSFEKKSKGAKE